MRWHSCCTAFEPMSKFFKALEEADRMRARRQQPEPPGGDATDPAPPPPVTEREEAPSSDEGPSSLDELKKLARGPFELVDRFIARARTITTEQHPSPTAAVEKFKQLQQALIRETEELLKTFRQKVSDKEQELHAALHPAGEDLAEQALKAVRNLYRIIERWSLERKLLRHWQERSAAALVAEYQKALRQRETDKIEIFEAEAERFLAQKGDPEATAKFVALRTQSQESRRTSTQKEAHAALQELSRIKDEVKIGLCFLASTFQTYEGLVPLSAVWRKEERHKLDQVDQRGISLTVHKDERTSLPASLVEFSKSGLKVQTSQSFPAGATLGLSMEIPGMTERAVSFKGKVRWCKEEPDPRGRYAIGLHLIEGPEGGWKEFFPTLLNQLNELNNLFSSLGS